MYARPQTRAQAAGSCCQAVLPGSGSDPPGGKDFTANPESNPEKEMPVSDSDQENLAERLQQILASPSYRIAHRDVEFLSRAELRPLRMQLELLKPEMAFQEQDVRSTIVVFGGTQIVPPDEAAGRLEAARRQLAENPDDPACQRAVVRAERVEEKATYYEQARRFAGLVARDSKATPGQNVIITGGGPGIMEAANRGAAEQGAPSIGLNIRLPEEQAPNPYITPELCFHFRYFAMRKMHFLLRARALVIFPGGFGTLDELFDALTLRQTGRMQEIPILLYSRDYWSRIVDFSALADEGVIRDEHLDLLQYADTPESAWRQIQQFHQQHPDYSDRPGGSGHPVP